MTGRHGAERKEETMANQLRYRRQFILTRRAQPELDDWRCLKLGDFYLQAHPDLEISAEGNGNRSLVLLGYLFDFRDPQATNNDILHRLLVSAPDFAALTFLLKEYPGRYALFYRDDKCFCLVQDALSLREVYYCQQGNEVVCGSQPNILERFARPALVAPSNLDLLEFIQSHLPYVRNGRLWVGDETRFEGVKHLMPNHYLDLSSMSVHRYWPVSRIQDRDLDEAAKLTADYLRGVLRAVTHRYTSVMMAVTSGTDSRSLLAASRGLNDRIYYFINRHKHLTDDSPDIRIPKQIFDKLHLPFHIHDVQGSVDEEFRSIFLSNTHMAKEGVLPAIYNVYYKNHQEKLNILGVGEIGREFYGKPPSVLDGYYLARCLKYRKSKYAIDQCDKWLQETLSLSRAFNADIMQLFLWECLLGNWGPVGNSESDIAIEEFDPYDSHYVYEIMLAARKGGKDVFRSLFLELWPELLDFPFNPPQTMKDCVKALLKRIGIYKTLRQLRYRFDRWSYYRTQAEK